MPAGLGCCNWCVCCTEAAETGVMDLGMLPASWSAAGTSIHCERAPAALLKDQLQTLQPAAQSCCVCKYQRCNAQFMQMNAHIAPVNDMTGTSIRLVKQQSHKSECKRCIIRSAKHSGGLCVEHERTGIQDGASMFSSCRGCFSRMCLCSHWSVLDLSSH